MLRKHTDLKIVSIVLRVVGIIILVLAILFALVMAYVLLSGDFETLNWLKLDILASIYLVNGETAILLITLGFLLLTIPNALFFYGVGGMIALQLEKHESEVD